MCCARFGLRGDVRKRGVWRFKGKQVETIQPVGKRRSDFESSSFWLLVLIFGGDGCFAAREAWVCEVRGLWALDTKSHKSSYSTFVIRWRISSFTRWYWTLSRAQYLSTIGSLWAECLRLFGVRVYWTLSNWILATTSNWWRWTFWTWSRACTR